MDHPEVQAAVESAVRRVRAAGRAPGVLTTSAASARHSLDMGALFIYVALASLLQPGARDFLSVFK
jgi:4-hydroxy-2-oxoheptanedioate aldolase